MISQLNFLLDLTNELRLINSSNEKKEILAKYYSSNPVLFNKLMDFSYSFDKKYWVTSDNVEKLWNKFPKKFDFNDEQDLFDILSQLTNRIITGHDAINYVIDLINFAGKEYKDIIFCIINKDLKANTNVALINKVSPKAIKEFKVALAERFGEAPEIHQPDFTNGTWMVSRKLDGVRTLAMENNGEIELYSRTGSLFATLDNLKPQVKKILDLAKEKYGTDFVLDGETCLVTHDGKDDFSGIMKQITRKKFTIENPSYILFDLIKKSEFDATKGETIFKDRMNMLENLQVEKITKNVKIVQHENSVSKESFQHWLLEVKKNEWEGLVLRDQNSVYNGKRSFDLQKVKSFFDAEYKVEDIEIGKKKMLIDGKMVERECVKSLLINHNGAITRVGSGLSDDERIAWFNDRGEIIGKIITVQYFEESIDSATGMPSLRFPTLKVVHGIERKV